MHNFTQDDGRILLAYSRYCIEKEFNYLSKSFEYSKMFVEKFTEKLGLFVSLYNKVKLRACLGQLQSEQPIFQLVDNMSVAAVTRDHRFEKINIEEIPYLTIELSILGPLKKINDISEIILGKHGVYMEINGITGTFLPQVAITKNWNIEEFLGNCSMSKAGLSWGAWKSANIFTYETIVFKEMNY
jgi:AmmeMemoRadiSam system protein A